MTYWGLEYVLVVPPGICLPYPDEFNPIFPIFAFRGKVQYPSKIQEI